MPLQVQTLQTQPCASSANLPSDYGSSGVGYALSDDQRRSLNNSSQALSRWGWISFWLQLALTLSSTGILLFSVAFTTTVRVLPLTGNAQSTRVLPCAL